MPLDYVLFVFSVSAYNHIVTLLLRLYVCDHQIGSVLLRCPGAPF